MNLDEIRAQIWKAMEEAEAFGYYIVGNGWGLKRESARWAAYGDKLCPLGALLRGRRAHLDERTDAADILGVSYDWVSHFVVGVDVGRAHVIDREDFKQAVQLGAQIMYDWRHRESLAVDWPVRQEVLHDAR